MGVFGMCKSAPGIFSDPKQNEITDFRKYQTTLVLVRKSLEDFEASLGYLSPMHDVMRRKLTEFVSNAPPEVRTAIQGNADHFQHIATAFDDVKPEYVELKQKMDKVEAEMYLLDRKLRDRTAAWKDKCHYESKVEAMKKKRPNATSPRLDRNMRKLSAASNRWVEIDTIAGREMKTMLDARYETLGEIVKMHRAHLQAYFGRAADLFGPAETGDATELIAKITMKPIISIEERLVSHDGDVISMGPSIASPIMSPNSPITGLIPAPAVSSTPATPDKREQSPERNFIALTPTQERANSREELPSIAEKTSTPSEPEVEVAEVVLST